MNKTDISITTVDLLRHGECVDGQCYRGSIDVALSEQGLQQMQNRINGINVQWQRIVSSPLMRCLHFSENLSAQKQLPLTVEAGFKEMHFGEWEGQSLDAVWETQGEAVRAWLDNPILSPPPAGEAADTFAGRVREAFENVIREFEGEHVLLVSHGGVMRALLVHCLAMPLLELNRFDIPYACLSRIQVVNDQGNYFYRLLAHNISS